MNIRSIRAEDAEKCGQIIYQAFAGIAERHNFPRDFPNVESATGMAQMAINDPCIDGFAAEDDEGRFLGSNFLWRHDQITGVGPITVDPTAQAKGVGRRLMQAVIECGKDAPGIRLVQAAFNTASMSLYADLGFNVVEPMVVMQGVPASAVNGGASLSSETKVRPLEEKDLDECAELCRKVHGFDRRRELARISQMLPAFAAERNGRIVAYTSAPVSWHLNHAVAEKVEDMQSLLVGSARLTGQLLAFLLPIRQAELFRWCLAQKLRVVMPMTLMAMGAYQKPRGTFLPSVLY